MNSNIVDIIETCMMTGTESKVRSKISDEERTELMKQMDKDLEEHFAKIEAIDAKRLFGNIDLDWMLIIS